ncbi:MAG TPA: universal stress protein [Vicinamibacterales bacterium]
MLCPIDFSTPSRAALRTALALAATARVRLHVLAVIEDGSSASAATPLSADARPRLEQAARDAVTAELPAGSHWAPAIDVSVKSGAPDECIRRTAVETDADLIVLGTHGRSGGHQWALGSTAARLLRTPPCAVLLISGETATFATLTPDRPELSVRRILAATDFGKDADRAVSVAAALARDWHSELVLAHVLPALPPQLTEGEAATLAEYDAGMVEAATDHLRAMTAGTRGVKATHCLQRGTPHVELLALATRERADLIVIGSVGRGTSHQSITGFTAWRMAGAAPCPILLLPSPRQVEEARL